MKYFRLLFETTLPGWGYPFGVFRPCLARAFQEPDQDGISRIERREIILTNKEKLNNLLHQ
jgi:hypothetical protein